MRKGGGLEGGNVCNRPRTEAINVLLSFSFAVILYSMYLRFRQVKQN
jgi:hypothetical protein